MPEVLSVAAGSAQLELLVMAACDGGVDTVSFLSSPQDVVV